MNQAVDAYVCAYVYRDVHLEGSRKMTKFSFKCLAERDLTIFISILTLAPVVLLVLVFALVAMPKIERD